jgi:hypothetical protein
MHCETCEDTVRRVKIRLQRNPSWPVCNYYPIIRLEMTLRTSEGLWTGGAPCCATKLQPSKQTLSQKVTEHTQLKAVNLLWRVCSPSSLFAHQISAGGTPTRIALHHRLASAATSPTRLSCG